jgi:DNA-binding response OmpR family regulator
VLIVEDEWLLADHYASILRDAGYSIVGPAPSLDEAIGLVSKADVDAALADINLRGTLSYPLAERLATQKVPFAFLTGYHRADLPRGLAQHPLVRKPVQPAELLGAVQTLLKKAQAIPTTSPRPESARVRDGY